jgi:hypothetical protein
MYVNFLWSSPFSALTLGKIVSFQVNVHPPSPVRCDDEFTFIGDIVFVSKSPPPLNCMPLRHALSSLNLWQYLMVFTFLIWTFAHAFLELAVDDINLFDLAFTTTLLQLGDEDFLRGMITVHCHFKPDSCCHLPAHAVMITPERLLTQRL